MLRRERVEKCIKILSLIYSGEEIMNMSPQEIEEKVFEILVKENKIAKRYLEEVYDKRKNNRTNKKVS